MALAESAYLEDELAMLYVQQRQSERAELDGRVTDTAAWRAAIDRRAEQIRLLEKRLSALELAEGHRLMRCAATTKEEEQ